MKDEDRAEDSGQCRFYSLCLEMDDGKEPVYKRCRMRGKPGFCSLDSDCSDIDENPYLSEVAPKNH